MSNSTTSSTNIAASQGNSDRVFRALREARSQLESLERSRNERVAIIGMAGRFPGADNLDEFWQLISEGKSGIKTLSEEELLASDVEPSVFDQPDYVPAYASFSQPDGFDAAFFGYSPREAEVIDPQHRVFLECAWSALEDAGYNSKTYDGSIGVYGGAALNSYLINLHSQPKLRDSLDDVQVVVSNVMGLMPTRVSYKLDLTGPSCGIQTGCSTSLVTVHLACQSLLNHDCDIALAGGVTVTNATPEGYVYQPDGIASPDGRCRAFDAEGKGTVFGNGVGIVVLKRLQAAMQDGDHIYAVIKGTAINNDGAQKVGLTAPSVKGQADVIAAALNQAGVSADSIGYVETHGTGTALGDPIEIAALTQAFWKSSAHANVHKGDAVSDNSVGNSSPTTVENATDRPLDANRCAIGSVKTNLGHLDAAAGVAGLIKAALALHHKVLPPSLNFQQPNPKIDFANSPFHVQIQPEAWERNGQPRRAGVSSFGMGGTNAHAILEEAPVLAQESEPQPQAELHQAESTWQLIPLSARTTTALERATGNLAVHLRQADTVSLQDVAYTLQTGRQALRQRQFCLAQSNGEAVEILDEPSSPRLHRQQSPNAAPPIFFLFSGQGSQYGDMGRGLYETYPLFREIVDRCSHLLEPHLDVSLLALLYPDRLGKSPAVDSATISSVTAGSGPRNGSRTQSNKLRETAYAQPALFVIEYALAKLWMSWGIQPQALMGHSLGEYTAACLAGVFSLEDALPLVAMRGKLMQQCPPGAMLSVSQSEADLLALLASDDLVAAVRSPLTIAVINGPQFCAVSGPAKAITQLQSHLEAKDISCQRLYTSHGFHSPLMEPCLKEFATHVAQVSLHPPQLELISNVTGTWMTDAQATSPDYWVSHIRQAVRFGDGIGQLLQTPNAVYLEVGPGQTLCRLTQQVVAGTLRASAADTKKQSPVILNSLPHPKDQQLDSVALLQALGKLWQAGVEVNWEALHQPEQRRRTSLPTYPFERERYWIERRDGRDEEANELEALEKKADLADWFYQPSWRRSLLSPSSTLSSSSASTDLQVCLFFAGNAPISQQFGQRLTSQYQKLIWVTPGDSFAATDKGFTLNPDQPEDYRKLVSALAENNAEVTQMVHLWDVDQGEYLREIHSEAAQQSQQAPQLLAFNSLVSFAQAFKAHSTDSTGQQFAPLTLHVVTQGIHPVLGNEAIDPLRATVLAPCKVLPQEFSGWRCRNLDVVLPPAETPGLSNAMNRLVDCLVAEITTPEADSQSLTEPTVAYRDGYRWTPTLEPVALPEVLEQAGTLPLQPGGVYLIAGDIVEGLGTLFAQWLKQTCQAKLVIIGRPGFPSPSAWEQWLLTHSPAHEISRCIRRLQALGSVGTDLLWFSADLAEQKPVAAAIAQAQEKFGPIQGVIHAGAMGDRESCMVNELDLATRERTFRSKIQGLQVIETCLQSQELDFYLLQSSLSSIVGGVGFGAYAAANLYLDSLATQRRRQAQAQGKKTVWLSLNWDACQLERADTATSQPIIGSALADSAMLPPEVQATTARALGLACQNPSVTQLAISPTDLLQRVEQWILHPELLHQNSSDAESISSDEPSSHSRPQISNAYVAPRNAVEQVVAEALAELLGLEQVGIHDNFFELGGHSLLAIQAITRLRKTFEVEIPMREFLFESPTAAGIAAMVERHQPKPEEDQNSQAKQASEDDISQLLGQIEEMSPDDVSRELQI